MKMTRVIESTHTYQVTKGGVDPRVVVKMSDRWTVRIWRHQDKLQDEYDNSVLTQLIFSHRWRNKAELAEALAEQERVNAVEVKDEHGEGILIYPEWP